MRVVESSLLGMVVFMPPLCRIEFDTLFLLEVHYFYQPQGWSTCAAGPGPGPGAGAGDVQLF